SSRPGWVLRLRCTGAVQKAWPWGSRLTGRSIYRKCFGWQLQNQLTLWKPGRICNLGRTGRYMGVKSPDIALSDAGFQFQITKLSITSSYAFSSHWFRSEEHTSELQSPC